MTTEHRWLARWVTAPERDDDGREVRAGGELLEACCCGAVYRRGSTCPMAPR